MSNKIGKNREHEIEGNGKKLYENGACKNYTYSSIIIILFETIEFW